MEQLGQGNQELNAIYTPSTGYMKLHFEFETWNDKDLTKTTDEYSRVKVLRSDTNDHPWLIPAGVSFQRTV